MSERAHLSERQRHEILKLYAAGVPVREIAAAYGIDGSYPSLLARRYRIRMRAPGNPASKWRPPNPVKE